MIKNIQPLVLRNFRRLILVYVILFNCSMTGALSDKSQDFMTLSELFEYCGLPSESDNRIECEGQTVKVKGYVDYLNVFDKEHYPQLPYEKFIIYDTLQSNTLEIWVLRDNSKMIFKEILQHKNDSSRMIHIRGEVEGLDVTTMNNKQRWIKINIRSENDIFFK